MLVRPELLLALTVGSVCTGVLLGILVSWWLEQG